MKNTLLILLGIIIGIILCFFNSQKVEMIKFTFPKDNIKTLELRPIICKDNYCVLDYIKTFSIMKSYKKTIDDNLLR